jgi:hypothetical protein
VSSLAQQHQITLPGLLPLLRIGGGEIANPGPSWPVAGVGDFNGDGKSDILLQHNDGDLLLWEMNGTTGIGGGEIANPGLSWHLFSA